MHRSMVKLFLVSGLLFGMHTTPLVAMSQKSFSNLVELKGSYQELHKGLLPWSAIPAVFQGIHSLGNLTIWLQENSTDLPSNISFVRDLFTARECFTVVYQKCPDERVQQLAARVIELLRPLGSHPLNIVSAREVIPVAPQFYSEQRGLAFIHDKNVLPIAVLSSISRSYQGDAQKNGFEQKVPGGLTEPLTAGLPANPGWSPFNGQFHVDLSPIRADLSPTSFLELNQSSNASTPPETPRIGVHSPLLVEESIPTTSTENNALFLVKTRLKNTERCRDMSARDKKMSAERYPKYTN